MNLCFSEPFVRDFLFGSHIKARIGSQKTKTSWTTHFAVHYWRLQGQINFVLSSKRYVPNFGGNLLNVGSAHVAHVGSYFKIKNSVKKNQLSWYFIFKIKTDEGYRHLLKYILQCKKKKKKKNLDLLSTIILQVQKAICGEFNVQIAANNSNYGIGIGNIQYIPAVAMWQKSPGNAHNSSNYIWQKKSNVPSIVTRCSCPSKLCYLAESLCWVVQLMFVFQKSFQCIENLIRKRKTVAFQPKLPFFCHTLPLGNITELHAFRKGSIYLYFKK